MLIIHESCYLAIQLSTLLKSNQSSKQTKECSYHLPTKMHLHQKITVMHFCASEPSVLGLAIC